MARKRINYKVLGILAVAGTAAAASPFAIKYFRPHNTKQAHLEAAQAAHARDDIYDEIGHLRAASSIDPKDTELHLQLGALLAGQVTNDWSNLSAAADEYNAVTAQDPKNKAAWLGLVDVYQNALTVMESGLNLRLQKQMLEYVRRGRDAAERVAQLAGPDDVKAQAAGPIITLRMWMLELALPANEAERNLPVDKRPTDDQRVEKALADLTEMSRKHPEEAQLPYYIARAKIRQGDLARQSPPKAQQAPALYAEAAATFDDAIAAQKTPEILLALNLDRADVLTRLAERDSTEQGQREYRQKIKECYANAQKLADPKAPAQYLKAKWMYARNLASTDPGGAEVVYRELMKAFPDNIDLKRELARMLRQDTTRVPDALAVLDQVKQTPPAAFNRFDRRKAWETGYAKVRLDRIGILIEQMAFASDARQRVSISDDIKSSLASIGDLLKDDYEYLKIRGRYELSNGQFVSAVQTLSLADDKAKTAGRFDSELLGILAQSYRSAGQQDKALEVIATAMQDPIAARNPEMHSMLAEIFLTNNDLPRAKAQIKWLSDRYPDSRSVIQQQIRALGNNPDPVEAQALYDRLPEVTVNDLMTKGQIAAFIRKPEEYRRVLVRLHEALPDNDKITSDLANNYVSTNEKEKARQIVADARKRRDSLQLTVLAQHLDDATAPEIEHTITDAIDKGPDYEKFCSHADLCIFKQDYDGAIEWLNKAAKVKPNDMVVNDRLFALYLDTNRLADAEALLPTLSAINGDQASGLMYKVKVALARRDSITAIAVGRQLTGQFGEFSASYQYLGDGYRIGGQLQQAIDQYVIAINKQSTNYDALNALIDCYVGLNDPPGARRYIAEARAKYPGDLRFLAKQVEFEVLFGNAEPLLPELEKKLAEAPGSKMMLVIDSDALIAVRHAKIDAGNGEAADKLGATAVEALRKGVEMNPDDQNLTARLAEILADIGDLPGAEKALLAFADRPRWKGKSEPQTMLGSFYYGQGKYDQAEVPLRKAVDLDPKNQNLKVALAQNLWREDKRSEATVTILPACDKIGPRELYSEWMVVIGKGAQAELETIDALKTNPRDKILLTNLLIHIMTMNNKVAQAYELADRFIKENPTSMYTYYLRGGLQVMLPNPDLDLALRDLTAFRDAYPELPKGRIGLADIYSRRREPALAIKELEVAVRLVPRDKRVRLALLEGYLVNIPPQYTAAERLLAETTAQTAFRNDPDFKRYAARVALGEGDSTKAMQLIREAIAASKVPNAYADDYLKILLEAKNYTQLYEESNKLAADPNANWVVYNYRAIARGKTGDTNGAADDFGTAMDKAGLFNEPGPAIFAAKAVRDTLGVDKAIEMVKGRSANSFLWKLVLLDLYQNEKRYDEGLAAGQAALVNEAQMSQPDRRALVKVMVAMAMATNPPQYDRAMPLLRKMVADVPDDIASLNDLACVLVDSPAHADPKEALVYSKKAFDLSVEHKELNTRIYDTYGWSLIRAGQPQEGMEVIRRALDKVDFPDAHYHMAIGYLSITPDQPEDAKRQLNLANDVLTKAVEAGYPIDQSLVKKINEAIAQTEKRIAEKAK